MDTNSMADEQQVHTLKINDQEYEIDKLSDAAKAEIRNLRFAEGEVQRLTALLALAQTARNAYTQALMAALPVVEKPTSH